MALRHAVQARSICGSVITLCACLRRTIASSVAGSKDEDPVSPTAARGGTTMFDPCQSGAYTPARFSSSTGNGSATR